MPVTHGDIGGAEPSTITFRVDTVTIDQNSTVCHREVLVTGDPQTSNAFARVVAAPPVSTEFGLIVRIAGGPSSLVDLAVRAVPPSTAADNPVLISGNSTAVISAFAAGLISSAASAGNSSALLVRVVGGASSGADFPVTLPANSSQVEVRALPANSSQVEVRALPANSSQVEVRNTVTIQGNSTHVFAAGHLSSAVVNSNSSALVVRVNGGVSSAVDFPVRAVLSSTSADNPVTVSGNSTVVVSAFAAGLISSAAPAGNSSALLVRVVSHGSSAVDFPVRSVLSSTSADNPVQISGNSTAILNLGTLQSSVAPAGGSSGLIVRIAGGPSSAVDCTIRAALSSTGTDNPVSASLNLGALGSSSPPAVGSSGLIVRPVMPTIATTASTNAMAGSTALSIASSVAAKSVKVFAYSITSTVQAPTVLTFRGAGGTLLWPVNLAAISSAITGVNLAVSPPGWLFAGASAGPVTLNIASTLAGFKVGVSYFVE